MSNKGGPVFTFSLPGAAARPLTPQPVTLLLIPAVNKCSFRKTHFRFIIVAVEADRRKTRASRLL